MFHLPEQRIEHFQLSLVKVKPQCGGFLTGQRGELFFQGEQSNLGIECR